MSTDGLKKDPPKYTELVAVKVEPAMKKEIVELCEFMDWDYAKFLRQALRESVDSVKANNEAEK